MDVADAVHRHSQSLTRISLLAAAISIFFSTSSGDSLVISGGIVGLIPVGIAALLSEVQYREAQRLKQQLQTLQARTPTEQGTAAAITGQSELATMTYGQLIEKMRHDGHIE